MPTGSFDEMTESVRRLRNAFLRMGIDLAAECCNEPVIEKIEAPQITEDELIAFLEQE